MSLPLKLDFSNYDNFLTEENYTTSAEAQDYFRNMDEIVTAMVDVGLWQPETNYPNGHVVFSPNMPNGTEAVCVATNGGKSSNTEPSWGEVGGDNVSDGTCFWKLRWKHWSKDVASVDDMTNGTSNDKIVTPYLATLGQTATNRLPNTNYAVGNVVYNRSNLSVALKCTTAGTTSADELDISGNNIGDTVTDGSVVWQVCNRTSDVTSVNGQTGDVNIVTIAPGFIQPYCGTSVPTGWLACNGAAVSRTTYSKLFSAIGTTYGSGDGSTTFNLPNMGTSLISAITNTNIPVKGNGKGFLLYNGTNNCGIFFTGDNGLNSRLFTPTTAANAGSTFNGSSGGGVGTNILFGVSTNAALSGLVANMTATKTTVKYCIKY